MLNRLRDFVRFLNPDVTEDSVSIFGAMCAQCKRDFPEPDTPICHDCRHLPSAI